jgi:hypothetical protein
MELDSGVATRPRELPRLHRWAGVSAIATVVLFIVANMLWAGEQPPRGAEGFEVVAFYSDFSGRIIAGGLISLVAVALSVVFASAFRGIVNELSDDELLGNLVLGGTVLGAAAGICAEGINAAGAMRAQDGELSEPLALAFFDISFVFGSYGAAIGYGLVALAIGMVALRSGALLPRWLALVALAIGVGMVTPLFGAVLAEATVGPAMLLLVVVGIQLLRWEAVTPLPQERKA